MCLLLSCRHEDASTPSPTEDAGVEALSCPAGFAVAGSTCAPVYDACDESSVPRLGGGCVRVGVPKDGCAAGFSDDGHGGCAPVLPSAPCPTGMVALPGETTCRDIAPCGTGTFGDIPVDASTVYVDQAYGGGGSDGSLAKPWVRIVDAVTAAKPGSLVAVAAGSYDEGLQIYKPLRLWGRCPSMVTLKGHFAGIIITARDAKVEIHRMKLVGHSVGIYAADVTEFLFEELWIDGPSESGIQLVRNKAKTQATVRRSLVEHVALTGLLVDSASMSVESSVIRDIQTSKEPDGTGMRVLADVPNALPGELVVKGSVVERCSLVGLEAQGAKVTIEGSLVRDMGRATGGGEFGAGLYLHSESVKKIPSELLMRGSVVTGNATAGLQLDGCTARIERSVISNTRSADSDGTYGRGIQAQRGELSLLDSLVDGNREGGVLIFAGRGTLERSIVRDTSEQKSDGGYGYGVAALHVGTPTELLMKSTLVLRSRFAGVMSIGSNVTLEGCAVAETRPQLSDGGFGDGAAAASIGAHASLTLDSTVVRKNARSGAFAAGATLALKSSGLTCNKYDLDAENGTEPFSLDDRGGNACGCGVTIEACHAVSAGLAPITVPVKPK